MDAEFLVNVWLFEKIAQDLTQFIEISLRTIKHFTLMALRFLFGDIPVFGDPIQHFNIKKRASIEARFSGKFRGQA